VSDEMRDDERTDASSGATETTTAVDDAFVTVPETEDAGPSEAAGDEWEDIQTGFVDRPRESVEQADRLVLEVIQQLQASFTLARERLESRWSEGAEASTEDLRQALRHYRSFFDRLLAT
jgi:hypothetical protein